jgi:hypothetical protein
MVGTGGVGELRLATYAHVSDLHIGRLDSANDDAIKDAGSEPFVRRFTWFDGYLGHTGLALRHLNDCFAVLEQTEQAKLIITGDVTTSGHPAEFELARQYITQVGALPNGSLLGLGAKDAFARAVPGNHDHWPGRRAKSAIDPVMLGAPTPALKGAFPHLPAPLVYKEPLRADVDLVVLGISTDFEVRSSGLHRFFARGQFDNQLANATGMLGPPKANEIRVLLMHHSPGWRHWKLGISQRSRDLVHKFVAETGIRIVLTGHAHVPGGLLQTIPAGAGSHQFLEARSGTTTQRDEFPAPPWKPRPLSEPNSLLVHRLIELPGPLRSIEWRTDVLIRTSRGFVSASNPPVRNPPQPIHGAFAWPASIRVWP